MYSPCSIHTLPLSCKSTNKPKMHKSVPAPTREEMRSNREALELQE